MPKVDINDAQGLVQSAGSGVTISSSVTVTGDATFSGTVTGVVGNPNVLVLTDPSVTSPETYDLTGGVRVVRYSSAFGGPWTIAALQNLSLPDGQAAQVRILGSTVSDRVVTLTGMTVDDTAATVSPASVKVKASKSSGVNLDIVNSGGSYFVFGSSLVTE